MLGPGREHDLDLCTFPTFFVTRHTFRIRRVARADCVTFRRTQLTVAVFTSVVSGVAAGAVIKLPRAVA